MITNQRIYMAYTHPTPSKKKKQGVVPWKVTTTATYSESDGTQRWLTA
jgi:hypothetical protein